MASFEYATGATGLGSARSVPCAFRASRLGVTLSRRRPERRRCGHLRALWFAWPFGISTFLGIFRWRFGSNHAFGIFIFVVV